MEAPPDPRPHASAAAPLRAPEVARLREEQEKVTGRAPSRAYASGLGRRPLPGASLAPGSPSPWLGPDPGPTPCCPQWAAALRSGPRTPDPERGRSVASRPGKRVRRNFCHVLLLSFVWDPLDLRREGRFGERRCNNLFTFCMKVGFKS